MNDISKLITECRVLCEALNMKKLTRYKDKYQNETRKWNIEIDGTLIGRMERSDTEIYGEEGYFEWIVYIYTPGTKTVGTKEYIQADIDLTKDPNEAFKKMAMSSRTRKAVINAIEAHGVSVNNLNKKHFKPTKGTFK